MPRGMSTLTEFACFGCGKTLGWTAPGEAGRINVRAHVFCEVCKDVPAGLTERQQQLVDILAAQKQRGERPTLSKAADEMGISRSRVHQIATAIKARGADNEIDAILYGVPTLAVVPALTVESIPAIPAPEPTKGETWEYPVPEYTAPPSGVPDSQEDPAMFGGDFVV